jgi:predicted enzyme related to lactoylglutathione lyase
MGSNTMLTASILLARCNKWGFFQKTDDKAAQDPLVDVAVENSREHMMNVEKLGGKVLGEPVDILGVGLYVPFIQPF